MSDTNYCAEILTQRVAKIPCHLNSSQKFRIPEMPLLDWKGRLCEEMFQAYCTPWRLPFERIAIETPTPGHPTISGAVIQAFEFEVDDGAYAVLAYVYMRDRASGEWDPQDYTYGIDSRGGLFITGEGDAPVDRSEYEGNGQIVYEALTQFVAATRCSNVQTEMQLPPEKLNRKRAAAGKVPFFSYHVLKLEPARASSSQAGLGSHASPRVHLRRGHVRRLPQKLAWVNACVVGNKALGMVSKDYEVRA